MTMVRVSGLGTAVPHHRASQRAFASFVIERLGLADDESRFVRLVSERSGIEWRHAAILED
ncbi:MAG: hypothetical protein KDA28_01140, partial [Phycisphaerales bacterium]|nr:hypothetical protein [Phycisphaerales bacterium]